MTSASFASTYNLIFLLFYLRIPCHARVFVLDKIGFSPDETMEVKRVYLKTEHGYTFNVKLYNADTYTYFECKTWQALCKAYAFEPDMVITFDIRPEDDIEGNRDIWVDVQTPPVLPLCEFFSTIFLSLILLIQK